MEVEPAGTLALAKHAGLRVIATSRSEEEVSTLKAAGADEVVIDGGVVAEQVRASHAGGVDCVLELIGVSSLLDEAGDISGAQLQEYVTQVERGKLSFRLGPTFRFSHGRGGRLITTARCAGTRRRWRRRGRWR